MKILVVGGSGYIGFEVCQHLRAKGHSVFCLDPNNMRLASLIRAKVTVINAKVLTALGTSLRYAAIINLTGGLDDANLWGVEREFLDQIYAPMVLAKASPNARIIHVSTQYVYSGTGMVKERAKVRPVCDYGLVHLMAESGIANRGNISILRFGTVWGEGMYTRWDTWGNHFLNSIREKSLVDLFHAEALVSILSLQNAVKAIEWAITGAEGIYNVADTVDIRENVAKMILGGYLYTKRQTASPSLTVGMDCSKILKAGFKFQEE